MTGGGTGGHVIPAIAVARELRKRGHSVFFIGTREGLESRLVPPENFPIEYVAIGGLKRVGWRQTLRTVWQLPVAVMRCQALMNMSVVLDIAPAKGFTLPLISYGGSSLLSSMTSLGLLLSVSDHAG